MALIAAGVTAEGIVDLVAAEGLNAAGGAVTSITVEEATLARAGEKQGFWKWWNRMKNNKHFQAWLKERRDELLEALGQLASDTGQDIRDVISHWWAVRHERRVERRKKIRGEVQSGKTLIQAWATWLNSPERASIMDDTYTDAISHRTFQHLVDNFDNTSLITNSGTTIQVHKVPVPSDDQALAARYPGTLHTSGVRVRQITDDEEEDDAPPRKRVRLDMDEPRYAQKRSRESSSDERSDRIKRARLAKRDFKQKQWQEQHKKTNTTSSSKKKMPAKKKYSGYKGPESISARETKYVDTKQTIGASVGGGGTTGLLDATNFKIYHLNVIPQGTGESARVGKHVQLTRAAVHLQLQKSSDSLSGPMMVVAQLVFDHHPQGTTPTEAQMYADSHPLAFNNLDNRKRFTVLASKKVTFGPKNSTAGDTADTQNKIVKIYRSIQKGGVWLTEFDSGTAGTLSETRNGALYLVLRADTDLNNHVDYNFQARIRFADQH
jgi:hypothetical protein